jgi:hypothetical protein
MNLMGYFFNSGKYQALYWWNNTYSLNGANMSLTGPFMYNDGMNFPESAIRFAFNVSGTSSTIYQDPYLATAGVSITTLHISSVQQAIVNFVLQHEELLGGGVAIGAILVAIPYVTYRRRRLI